MNQKNSKKKRTAESAFAEKISRLREKLQLSQSDLAEKAGINPTALSRILSGERDLKPAQARSLAHALQTTALELLHETEHADLFDGWVPIEELKKTQEMIATYADENQSLTVQLEGMRAECSSLRTQHTEMLQKLEALEEENTRLKGEHQNFETMKADLHSTRRTLSQITSERDNLRAAADILRQQHAAVSQELKLYKNAYQQDQIKINTLRAELESAQSSIPAGWVLAGLAGIGIGLTIKGK